MLEAEPAFRCAVLFYRVSSHMIEKPKHSSHISDDIDVHAYIRAGRLVVDYSGLSGRLYRARDLISERYPTIKCHCSIEKQPYGVSISCREKKLDLAHAPDSPYVGLLQQDAPDISSMGDVLETDFTRAIRDFILEAGAPHSFDLSKADVPIVESALSEHGVGMKRNRRFLHPRTPGNYIEALGKTTSQEQATSC